MRHALDANTVIDTRMVDFMYPAERRSEVYGEESMPVISMFYGIIIRMFYFDTDKHKAPHIHVQYAEESAVIGLPQGDILEGALRPSKMKLVQAWLEIHRDELMADWQLAIEGQPVFKIEPLR